MKAWHIAHALRHDTNPRSGWMQKNGAVDPAKEELYIAFPGRTGGVWIRASGRWVSGYDYDGEYFGRGYGFFGRWQIRRAVRRWDREQKRREAERDDND